MCLEQNWENSTSQDISHIVQNGTYKFDYINWQPNFIKNKKFLRHYLCLGTIFLMLLLDQKRPQYAQVIAKKLNTAPKNKLTKKLQTWKKI